MEHTFIPSLELSPSEILELNEDITTFNSAIDSNPADSEAYVNFGLVLYTKCHLDKAIKAYNMALDLQNQQSSSLYILRQHLLRTK